MYAIVFPGQGSQYKEMAMDFNDIFDKARMTFQEIEEETSINIRKIIIENQNNLLNQTQFTQLAIFSSSLVIFKTLVDQIGFNIINPKIVLGHSLGEYSALVANNVLNIKDAANLIKIRSQLMNSAIKPNHSGMAAIIGKDSLYVSEVININKLNIEIANDNSPIQVVVSGLNDDINKAERIFLEMGVKRYIKLNVSAAFHSKYMNEAEYKLSKEIDKFTFSSSNIPIISNYNASINSSTNDIIACLKSQMSNKVKWTESIKTLEKTDISRIIEIGPGKVLSGLISRITNKFDIKSVDKIKDLEKFS